MSRYEENEFRMKPIDPEFQAYVVQRKTLNEQIQDHWKLELNTHVILGVFVFFMQIGLNLLSDYNNLAKIEFFSKVLRFIPNN